MPEITLTAITGRPKGSRPANRLRNEGKIPGVVYGHGMDPVPVAVDRRELRQALSGPAGVNAVVLLTIDGKTQPTVVKDIQRHPIRRNVTHIDFIVVRMNEAIVVEVPVEVQGEPRQVLNNNGIVEQQLMTLSVNTTPANIPNAIVVDVSDLEIGDVIRVADLVLPEGATADADPDTAVVVAASTAAAALPEAEEAEEGAAEGGEAASGEAESADTGE
jgi:large subunit ribosomal protein L25